jgi:hypothetical protein
VDLSRAHRRAHPVRPLADASAPSLRAIVAGAEREPRCHRGQSLCTSTTITATPCARSSSTP